MKYTPEQIVAMPLSDKQKEQVAFLDGLGASIDLDLMPNRPVANYNGHMFMIEEDGSYNDL